MKTKTVRECRVCGEKFDSITSYGIHVSKDHDIRPGGTDVLPLRPVSCWRCASDININQTDTCGCGFRFPLEMFNQQEK